jgi:hypothetical protein
LQTGPSNVTGPVANWPSKKTLQGLLQTGGSNSLLSEPDCTDASMIRINLSIIILSIRAIRVIRFKHHPNLDALSLETNIRFFKNL